MIVTDHVRDQSSHAAIVDAGDEKGEAGGEYPQINSFVKALRLRLSLLSGQLVLFYRLRLSRHVLHGDESIED